MTITKLTQNNQKKGCDDVLQLFPESAIIPSMPQQPVASYDDNFSIDDIVSIDLSDATADTANTADNAKMEVEDVSVEASDNYQLICNAINEENNSIALYSNLITMMSDATAPAERQHPEMVPVLKDILAEEHKHIGQLQALQKLLNANTKFIEAGEQEAAAQLGVDILHPVTNQEATKVVQHGFTPLKVTTLDPINKSADSNMKVDNGEDSCSGDDICSVSDIDDSF